MMDLLKDNDFLIEIGITIIIYIPAVIYLVSRILDNNNIPLKRKKIYIVLTCINLFLGALFYNIEVNKRLKEKYSSKSKDKNGLIAKL